MPTTSLDAAKCETPTLMAGVLLGDIGCLLTARGLAVFGPPSLFTVEAWTVCRLSEFPVPCRSMLLVLARELLLDVELFSAFYVLAGDCLACSPFLFGRFVLCILWSSLVFGRRFDSIVFATKLQ